MKEKILKCLREAEDYVSGQELCQMFDVSRTAIWKVMNQLKEDCLLYTSPSPRDS